jgi:uncharacterized membrane protein YuzA (DUF378 family)
VNREEAEKALGIIRTVIQNTRDDLAAHNWGLIWMIHAFINLAACLGGWYVENQQLPVLCFLVPLGIAAVLNLVTFMALLERDQGVRSYVELRLHGIWWTFIVFTAAGCVALQLNGAPPHLFGPIFAMTSGMSFAIMGVVFARQLPFAAVFLVITLVGPLLGSPGTPFAGVQWGLIGAGWWAALFFSGSGLHREKRQRAQHATATRLL